MLGAEIYFALGNNGVTNLMVKVVGLVRQTNEILEVYTVQPFHIIQYCL